MLEDVTESRTFSTMSLVSYVRYAYSESSIKNDEEERHMVFGHHFALTKSNRETTKNYKASFVGKLQLVSYPRECSKAVQFFHKTKHLQADGRHDDEETSCEDHQTAKFFTWTKYFVHKIFQGWGNLNQTYNT